MEYASHECDLSNRVYDRGNEGDQRPLQILVGRDGYTTAFIVQSTVVLWVISRAGIAARIDLYKV